MTRKTNVTFVAISIVGLVVGVALLARAWFPHEEEVIHARLTELANDLSVNGKESDLMRVARAARLRRYFVEDVRVELGEDLPTIDGVDSLVATAAKTEIPDGGIQVLFVDLKIKLEKDRAHANARTTVRASHINPEDGSRDVDFRPMAFTLERRRDYWLITKVVPMPTLGEVIDQPVGGS